MIRNIVVTGISRGLGKALCEGFLERGHRVAGCARRVNSDTLRALHDHPLCRLDTVDLTDDIAVGRWLDDVVAERGTPDLVINNAAIINANQALWDLPLEDFRELMEINVQGVFSVIRHIVPQMIDAQTGLIANFSSGWGRSVAPEVASYCCSKWGIEGLTLALAEELPAGIAAVTVNPGVINTDMLQSCFGEGANSAPSPAEWATRAVPFFLGLSAADNGRSLTV